MTPKTSVAHRGWLDMTESALWHVAALIVGFAMMVVGLGLGVTMIMLPVGVVVGLVGILVFVEGIFGRFELHR